jgi:hypothetical protein
MSRLLIAVGVALVVLGLLVKVGLPLGRLPGDFVFRRGNLTLYFPLATGILLSAVLSALLALLRR